MKITSRLYSTLTPLRVFWFLGIAAVSIFVLVVPGSFAKPIRPTLTVASRSDVAVAPPALPPRIQAADKSVQVMVELADEPAAVTWATAYKQAQAQLDAQRNAALKSPKLRSSQTLLRSTPQQAQIGSAAMTQVKSIAKSIDSKQISMLSSLTGPQIGGRVIYRAQMAYNGIAMMVDPSKISAIQKTPGVKAVHPLHPKYLVDTFSDIDFLNTRPAWTTGPFGTHGENIKVADLDTGLDYIHRNFGGSGSAADYNTINDTSAVPNADYPTPKVPNGIDLVGDAYTGSNMPVPDNNPLDCNGHGTATASLITGYGVTNTGFTYSGTYDATNPSISSLSIPPGFAPDAKIIPVRLFGCPGGFGASVSTNVVGEAIEWALTQGTGNPANRVDVINMSLGANETPADDPDAVAASNAAAVGIIICSAAGNAGDSYYIASTPASASGTMSVAASYNNQQGFVYQAVVDGNQPAALTGVEYKATKSTGAPTIPSPLTNDVVYGIPHDGGPATTPVTTTPLTNAAQCNGKIVLLDRGGGVTFEQKVKRALASGAVGVIIANNANNPRNDIPPVNVTLNFNSPIPEVGISFNDGNSLKAAAAFDAGDGHSTSTPPANVTLKDSVGTQTLPPNGAGSAAGQGSPDTMASYSSRGPRLYDSATKPDITSPAEVTMVAQTAADPAVAGRPITSASGKEFENFNGTSSATPHVAGEMALLRQLHPTWSVQELLALACNTATHDLMTTVAGPTNYGPGRVGAGRNDVGLAAAASVVAYNGTDPNLLGVSFGSVEVPVDGVTTLTKNITVSNKGAANITYNTSYLANPNIPNLGTTFSVSPANFTVNAGTTTTITVTLTSTGNQIGHERDPSVASTQSGLAREWLTEAGGYAVLTPTDSSPTLRVELYANPKPAAAMHSTITKFVPTSANAGQFTINLSGSSVTNSGSVSTRNIRSLVKAFELQYESPFAGQPNAPTDKNIIKYAGVTSDYITGGDDEIMFGVERFGFAATPDFHSADVEIFVDTNPADIGVTFAPNFAIFLGNFGQDSTVNLAGLENVYFPILVDLNTNVRTAQDFTNGVNGGTNGAGTNGFIDTNAHNNTGIMMPVFANAMGLGQFAGPSAPTSFQYQVVVFDYFGNEADSSPVLFYDLANPGLEVENSTNVAGVTKIGPFAPFEGFWYQDIASNKIPVNWNGANFQANGSIGVWLFHTHNSEGNRSDVVRFLAPTISGFSPTSAHVGDFITISGTNFNAGTAVTFFHNVNATTVNAISSTTLSVQVPSGATSGPIRVSNAAGSASKAGFTVLP
ncbi:MAG TPA: S8 family serine peptidase [Chthoniobacterales bacterium]|nr:S8 family serine peptidase [Chthoniobacterales bacterium]